MASATRPRTLSSWERGLIEQEAGDSRRLPINSLAAARNVRFDETGHITGRAGITAVAVGSGVAAGLPNANYTVEYFQNPSINALVASDGATIKVLESTGWVTRGTFPSAGTRASLAVANQRMYAANAIDIPRVIDFIAAAWNVRATGVAAPAAGPVMSGNNGTTNELTHYYTYIDNRGFESNGSPGTFYSGSDTAMHTATVVNPGGTIVAANVYSSLRGQRQGFYVGTITFPAITLSYTTLNSARDVGRPVPGDHNQPRPAIATLAAHEGRLHGMQASGFRSYDFFSKANDPEYWPTGFAFDLTMPRTASDALNFAVDANGLQMWTGASGLALEADPESLRPRGFMRTAGLKGADAIASNGEIALVLTPRGIISHDSRTATELWRRVKKSSADAVAAAVVRAAAHDTRISMFFRDADDGSKITMLSFDFERDRFTRDSIGVDTASSSIIDQSRDFAADTGAHEELENGVQTVTAGGATTIVTISGTMNAKVVIGCAIKFLTSATIYIIENIAGNVLTLDQPVPAGTPGVDFIRATQVAGGFLSLYGSGV